MAGLQIRFDDPEYVIPLPVRFFSDLLPAIDDLSELKVTLYCLWALQQKEGDYRYLRYEEILADDALMRGLAVADGSKSPAESLDTALEKAKSRGTLLEAAIDHGGKPQRYFVINDLQGQLIQRQLLTGERSPMDNQEIEVLPMRPTLFGLYEQNIGVLTPMIVDSIKEAEAEYPYEWIEDAIKYAVERNVRNWKYIHKVLESWRQEGRSREKVGPHRERHKQYTTGEWKDFIES